MCPRPLYRERAALRRRDGASQGAASAIDDKRKARGHHSQIVGSDLPDTEPTTGHRRQGLCISDDLNLFLCRIPNVSPMLNT